MLDAGLERLRTWIKVKGATWTEVKGVTWTEVK